jgi:hypothetical protein
MIYNITKAEYSLAWEAAVVRVEYNLKTRAVHSGNYKTYSPDEARVKQTEAFISEMLVARFLNIPYKYEHQTYKDKADVGLIHEVKHTKHQKGSLIVSSNDRQTDIAWLVIGELATYRLAGYIPILIARTDHFKHPDQGNWWLPQSALANVETYKRRARADIKVYV